MTRFSSSIAANTDTVLLARKQLRAVQVIDTMLLFGLCGVLVFGVLALGCVEEWSMFVFELATAVLFTLWALKQLLLRKVRLSSNPLYAPALLFLALIVAQLALHRTAYRYVTQYETLQYVSYGAVSLIAAECLSAEQARRAFALIMLIFGCLYASFALIQNLTSTGRIFWVHTPQFGREVFGSYVDRDHYAGIIELLVPLPLVLSASHLVDGGRRALIGFGGAVMASTIFLCGSRAGMVIFVVQLVLFAALTFRLHRNSRALLGSVGAFVVVAVLLVFLGNWQFLSRFGNLDPGIRLSISKDSLHMFAQRPIMGWGLGTFSVIYPSHRSFYTNLFINAAHNDYAQLLVETGLLGFGLMTWFVMALCRRSLASVKGWQFRWDAAVSLAAALGCSGILLHSLVDFNLQIPANSAVFYVLCALAASSPPTWLSRSSTFTLETRASAWREERRSSGSWDY